MISNHWRNPRDLYFQWELPWANFMIARGGMIKGEMASEGEMAKSA
jgi:hypothetical protein